MLTAYKLDKGQYGYDALNDTPAETDDTKMSARFLITSTHLDRDGDIVSTDGLDFSSHERNPVCFFNHGKSLPFPIALSQTPSGVYTVEVQKDHAFGTAYFKSSVRESAQIFELIRSGLLRGASIGFLPVEMEPRQKAGRGMWHKKAEITEWSVVGVPANSHALRAEIGKGMLAGSPVSDELKKALAPHMADKAKAWATGTNFSGSSTMTETKAAPAAGQPAEGEVLIGVLCPRTAFGGREDAAAWCREKGYDTECMTEEADGWHFQQPRDGLISMTTMRRVDLDAGVVGFVCKEFKGKPPPEVGPRYSGKLVDGAGKVFTVVDGRITKVFEPVDDTDPEEEPGVDCTFRLRDGRTATFVRGKMVAIVDPEEGDDPEPPALTADQEERIGSLEGVLGTVLDKQAAMLRKLGGK